MLSDDQIDSAYGALGLDIGAESIRRLERHLANWLGAWPDRAAVIVATSPYRDRPGWDGQLRPFVGVSSPTTTVYSVAERLYEPIRDLVDREGLEEFEGLESQIAEVAGGPGSALRRGVFRFHRRLVSHESRGEWHDPQDPVVPDWLRPFNAKVLVAFDEARHYAAGVGCKRHDEFAYELAITTDPDHRRRGYGRELVAQASEYVYLAGGVATYMHRRDNFGSAAVADSAGFPDHGWETIMLSTPGPITR